MRLALKYRKSLELMLCKIEHASLRFPFEIIPIPITIICERFKSRLWTKSKMYENFI